MKNILIITGIFLSTSILNAQESEANGPQGPNLLLELFSRSEGKPYMESDTTKRIHFIQDLLTVYNLHQEQSKRFYFMEAPSSPDFAKSLDKIDTLKMLSPKEAPNPLSDPTNTSFHFINRGLLKKETVTTKAKENLDFPVDGIPGASADRLKRVGSAHTFVNYHFKNYCDEYEKDQVDEEICKVFVSSNSSGEINTGQPSADINAASLFDLEEPTKLRAKDYIQNITDAFPQNPFPYNSQGEIDYQDKYVDVASKVLVDKAYRSMSQYVLNDIKNRRLPSKESNEGSSAENALSKQQLIEDLATSRLKKENNWLAQLESTSTEGLLREIAVIEASRLYLDSVAIKQNEHIEALLATIVAQNQNLAKLADFSSNINESEAGKSASQLTDTVTQGFN